MPTATSPMSDTEFNTLRKIVYDRSGIHFPDSKKYVLESRLARRLEELEFDSFTQYLQFLTIGPYQMDEFQEMFNRITINETSFFRNQPQLDVFENVVLPRLLKERAGTKRLRVWSAACSTGEEPFTLAMQIHRTLGLRLADWRIEILGTDISEKALTTASEGRYTGFSFRGVNPLVVKKYFTESGGFYTIDPTIQSMVTFELHNLKDALSARRHGLWDVIFCRNVMIYFDDAMKKQCVQMFHNQLAPDGTLFIGHSENLRSIDVGFTALDVPEAFAYVKAEGKKTNA